MTDSPNPSYLPSNSRSKAKDVPEKKIEKVVQNEVHVKKKPLNKRVGEAFLGDDAQTVKSYLVWDVLIPAAKDTIADLVKKGIDAILYGRGSQPSNIRRENGSSYVSYSSYSNQSRLERNDPPWRSSQQRYSQNYAADSRSRKRATHDFSDIEFTRDDAEKVLSQLVDITMQYGEASVADFYELAGVQASYTDNRYGWGELSDAKVVRTRNGSYILDLPRPEPLEG